jgi:cytochrome c biogenesis protein CcmG/thiol:disulfide interchange protein DsbE
MVDDVAREFDDKGLIVLAIDVLEPDQKVKKYFTDHPRSVPIVLTKDTNLAAMYNAQSYPIYVVIDRDGNIAAEQRGPAGEAALRRLLRRAGLESKPESEN